jgi:hypothetical protein
MKKRKTGVNSKLSLNKETIARLTPDQSAKFSGGLPPQSARCSIAGTIQTMITCITCQLSCNFCASQLDCI